jgi:hypothetical protein
MSTQNKRKPNRESDIETIKKNKSSSSSESATIEEIDSFTGLQLRTALSIPEHFGILAVAAINKLQEIQTPLNELISFLEGHLDVCEDDVTQGKFKILMETIPVSWFNKKQQDVKSSILRIIERARNFIEEQKKVVMVCLFYTVTKKTGFSNSLSMISSDPYIALCAWIKKSQTSINTKIAAAGALDVFVRVMMVGFDKGYFVPLDLFMQKIKIFLAVE